MVSLFLFVACGVSPELVSSSSTASPGALPAPELASRFWDHWGDGRAELSGYRLKTPRYGEVRDGRATLVVVTENFTDGQRVKSDGRDPDAYPVLKLNTVRDFQTGIYDYNVMTSTFHRLDSAGSVGRPVKVSMSMQEWCGHVYEQVLPYSDRTEWTSHSYFDGEADRLADLGVRADGMYEDALPVVVRGLLGPLVKPGSTVTYPVLPTLESGRKRHVAPTWDTLTLSMAEDPEPVTVPAGTFTVRAVTSRVGRGPTTTWFVEQDWPHRLVRWSSTDGEEAELLGTERLPYWERHNNGDEALLDKLGHPRPTSAW